MGYKDIRNKLNKKDECSTTNVCKISRGEDSVVLEPFERWKRNNETSEDAYLAFEHYSKYYIAAFNAGIIFRNPSGFRVQDFLLSQWEKTFGKEYQSVSTDKLRNCNIEFNNATISNIKTSLLTSDWGIISGELLIEDDEEAEEKIEALRKAAYTEKI